MFGLFGKKVACFQCNAKVKHKESRFRRGFRFCSEACVTSFLADNPLKPKSGDASEWTSQAKNHLSYAYAEMASIVRLAGGMMSGSPNIGGNILTSINNLQSMEELTDAFARYNSQALEALPFLYGLGLDEQCAAIEGLDMDLIYDLPSGGFGPGQEKKVRAMAEKTLATVERAIAAVLA